MPHTSWVSARKGESLPDRAETLLLLTRDLVERDREVDRTQPSERRLAMARTDLETLVNNNSTGSRQRAAACRLLVEFHKLEHSILEVRLHQQLSTMSEIRDGISGLYGMSPRQIITAAPMLVCRDLSLGRAMISMIDRSVWLPQRLYVESAEEGDSKEFEEFIDGARIPLSQAPLETELVRRRTPAIVNEAAADRRTCKRMVDLSRSSSYVAAPVTVRGRVIGMIHADRPSSGANVTVEDLELLDIFTECLSLVVESAAVQLRIEQQVKRVEDMFAQVASVLEDTRQPACRFTTSAVAGPISPRAPYPAPPSAAALTRREREVLAQLATGATNAQIARNLLIAEGTVKNHLKQISKKLGTSTRAAAVAAYSRMTQSRMGTP
jgi:DNA-binding CsgD family transcriptional regulator